VGKLEELAELGAEGENIKIYFTETEWYVVGWVHQDREKWRALLNMVISVRVPQNAAIFLDYRTAGHMARVHNMTRGIYYCPIF